MTDLQWAVTTIIAILSLLAGRYWKQYEYAVSKDLKTMKRFDEVVTFQLMNFIRNHDFSSSFDNDIFVNIGRVIHEYERPDFIFLNKEMEKLNRKFIVELKEFQNILAINSGPINNPSFNRIPLIYDNPTANEIEIIDKVDILANNLFDTYSKLKIIAHRKL